jgi:hypothetical protein
MWDFPCRFSPDDFLPLELRDSREKSVDGNRKEN